jgi:GTP cyclohydrolase I
MTQTIANLVQERLNTVGVGCVISAEHSCMSIRGIRKPGSSTVTSALRGIFKTDPATRTEFMALINGQR